jgi:hypothetical protein
MTPPVTPALRQLVELLAREVARRLAADAPDAEKIARLRDSGAGGQGHEQEQGHVITKREQFNAR